MLTVIARMVSPVPLSELTLIAYAAGVIALFGHLVEINKRKAVAQD